MMAGMLTDAQYRFLETSRVGRLATADAKGVPHLVPVCYAVIGSTAYITVDEKPKRTDIPLKRIRNIQQNPTVALTVDRWDEDWSRLAWVMVRGRAEVLDNGAEHDAAQVTLRNRYPQYRTMDLAPLPVIAIRIGTNDCFHAFDHLRSMAAGHCRAVATVTTSLHRCNVQSRHGFCKAEIPPFLTCHLCKEQGLHRIDASRMSAYL